MRARDGGPPPRGRAKEDRGAKPRGLWVRADERHGRGGPRGGGTPQAAAGRDPLPHEDLERVPDTGCTAAGLEDDSRRGPFERRWETLPLGALDLQGVGARGTQQDLVPEPPARHAADIETGPAARDRRGA